MASYYFLMSSLPMLNPDGEMPFPYNAFLEMCRNSVSDSLFSVLQDLSVNSSKGAFLSKWSEFYAALADELTYQRNVRLGKAGASSSGGDSDAIRIVTAVMNEKNPLRAEEMLLSLEFEKLDELTSQHYFDECSLLGYALKLKLLERKTVFEHDRGKAEFKRILDYLQEQILRI